VGVRRPEVAEVLHELYSPFLRTDNPFLVMSPESAELTKYVANAMLATKISFINEMANISERLGGDINDIRRGIGHDRRIGFQFLFPGVGYGGSCFPKDIRALATMARKVDVSPRMLDAVDAVNDDQKHTLMRAISAHFSQNLRGKTVAVWGLAFKPRTDDVREAPALVLIDALLKQGAIVQAHDPEAMDNVREQLGDRIRFGNQPMDVLEGAHALAINTEWQEFRNPDFAEMKRRMASPVIFDGRNLYDSQHMRDEGFTYFSIGRSKVSPE
jgi:UDPglucose 6-dehydrogenase